MHISIIAKFINMKSNTILFLCILFLSASKCKKESDDCHKTIIIKNTTSSDVMYGWKSKHGNDKCYLSLTVIKANDNYDWFTRDCWEDLVDSDTHNEVYIVDPNHHNPLGISYPCDSIYEKNTILKHVKLSLEYLKKNNFTVTYP
jgi:hypothetical protein